MKNKTIPGLIAILILGLSSIAFGQEWLYFPTGIPKNWVNIGNLNVSGDSITIEALITPTDVSISPPKDIVSKHMDPPDCNYLLRHYKFEMTTTSGYQAVLNPVNFCADSTYHIAGTYDGDSIRYYVNGSEVASVHWTGTLVQNSDITAIGNISLGSANEQFLGYIDEVRIWKVARSPSEIQNNMYNLPNPTSQYGLLAYYKFDGNYNNMQGNSAYNGIPEGSQLEDITNPYFSGTVSNPPVTVSVSISASNNPVCQGTSVTFTANPVNGGNTPFYQWKVNGINKGIDSQTYTYSPLNGDVVTCKLTSSFACSINNPATSNSITMTVNTTYPVSVSINASSNPVCSGTSVTYTAIPINGGNSPMYQWKVNGINVGSNSQTYTYIPVNGDIVTCLLTSSYNCTTNNPAASNSINMTVNLTYPVSVSINASSNPVCSGTSVIYTATPTNGGSLPLYQWRVNGINVGLNSQTYTYIPVNGDIVTCLLTSSYNCTTNNPATSNPISMVVNNNLPVSITISPSLNPVCSGTSVTYTATPTNGGATPSYQWQVNGINIGTDNQTFTYTPTNGDLITCILTSSLNCTGNNPVTSNPISMVVNNNLPVSITISPSLNPICSGNSVIYSATATNGGVLPSYQWQVNGIVAGSNNQTFTYTPINGDVITCVLTSSLPCTLNNPATSNSITMIVNNNQPVSITISSSVNPICSGTSVTYTAMPTNEGFSPFYQWQVNGLNAGINNPIYSYAPNNGDIITCILTSDATCPTGNPANSNAITMTVNPNLPVSTSITASSNPSCEGSPVTFTVIPINGGAEPSYQWQVNGINVGGGASIYSYIPTNNDSVTCILSSSLSCVTGNPSVSNPITMTVNSNLPVGISITTSSNPFCPGSSVTFNAVPVNEGTSPSYEWKVNGTTAGTNSPTYSYHPNNGDSVRCIMTSNLICVMNNPASSADIIMNGSLAPLVTFTSCFDTITTVNAQPIRLRGGIPIGGIYSGPGVNSTTGVFSPSIAGTGTKTIIYTYTNVLMCSASQSLHVIVDLQPAFTCGNNLMDVRDNKVYPTIQLGSQCWMASNLNYGTELISTQNQRDNCISEKFCYNDNPINCIKLGGLYQWDELMLYDNTPANQGFCPPGWHIPTENEWNNLFTNWTNNGFAGSTLKYSGYSGFNALLTGENYFNKSWKFQNFATFFWSSTLHSSTHVWANGFNDPDPSVSAYPASRDNAFAVRCVED